MIFLRRQNSYSQSVPLRAGAISESVRHQYLRIFWWEVLESEQIVLTMLRPNCYSSRISSIRAFRFHQTFGLSWLIEKTFCIWIFRWNFGFSSYQRCARILTDIEKQNKYPNVPFEFVCDFVWANKAGSLLCLSWNVMSLLIFVLLLCILLGAFCLGVIQNELWTMDMAIVVRMGSKKESVPMHHGIQKSEKISGV